MNDAQSLADVNDPFLYLDHAGPVTLGPAVTPPENGGAYKGLAKVTLNYGGGLRYRSSSGAAGAIDTGDVLWLTAGAGTVYAQTHGDALVSEGGTLETVDLLINLPVAHKYVDPDCRRLAASVFPVIPLSSSGANYVRLVAGRWDGYVGPAKTYSPLTVADVYLDPGATATLKLHPEWRTLLLVLRGAFTIAAEADGEAVGEPDAAGANARVDVSGASSVRIVARASGKPGPLHLLLLSGEATGEPVAFRGGLALNTEDGLRQAELDAQTGAFGRLR